MFSHGFPSPQVKWKKIIITISKHTNCLTSFKTYGLRKLGNFKKILKMLVNKRKCPRLPEMKIVKIALENCKISTLQHLTEQLILLSFENLCAVFCPMLKIFIIRNWMCELPHELLENLICLGNREILENLKFYASLPSRNESLARKFQKADMKFSMEGLTLLDFLK